MQTQNVAQSQTEGSRAAGEGHTEMSDIVSRLEAENEELRRQLATLRPSGTTSHSTTTCSTSKLPDQAPESTHPSTNDPIGLKGTSRTTSGTPPCRDCSRVLRRYHALSANFKTAKDALQRRKDERNSWIHHSKYLKEKIQTAENEYGIQILDQKAQQMEVPTSTALEADEPLINPSLSFMSEKGSEGAEPQLPELALTSKSSGGALEGYHANSETTQGEASDEMSQPLPMIPPPSNSEMVVIKEEQSSDIPEIVSEREVRKRKRNEEDAGTTVVPKIKPEMAGSSSPIMLISPVQFHTQESIDLGDIVKKIQTPRKRQLLEQAGPQSEIIPRSKLTTFTPLHAGAQQEPQSAIAPRQTSALMPLSVNARTIRPSSVKIQQKSRWSQLNESIESLAEDGAAYNAQALTNQVKSPSVSSTKSRLNALLNEPLAESEDENIISRLPKRTESRTAARHADLGIPGRRQLPFDKDGHVSGRTTPCKQSLSLKRVSEAKTGGGSFASPRQTMNRQDSRPLRHMPLSKLGLEDFKVNPRANEGHDFAFSEVVRDKGDRSCLPGCTDMHCCGKEFRAIAISQRPNPPLTAAQRQEEQKLLEDYLGDFSYRLASMDKDERMEVWIEAKTHELANKYGKHRHRFSRMQSPPGFWDADFPDTQQLEADREEAVRRTRRAVAERYREARRPGGRWMFKDE